MDTEVDPIAEGWLARWWRDYATIRDSLWWLLWGAGFGVVAVVARVISIWPENWLSVQRWDWNTFTAAGGILLALLCAYTFFRTPWVQRNEARLEVGRLNKKNTDAHAYVGDMKVSLNRQYDPQTGSMSGPANGAKIILSKTTIIAGTDPLAVRAHLELAIGSDTPRVVPLGFVTDWGPTTQTKTQCVVQAGSTLHATMIGYINVNGDSEYSVCFVDSATTANIVIYDNISQSRRATLSVGVWTSF